MKLSKDEKKLITRLLEKHREEVQHIQELPNQSPIWISAEVKYDEWLEKLIKKIAS